MFSPFGRRSSCYFFYFLTTQTLNSLILTLSDCFGCNITSGVQQEEEKSSCNWLVWERERKNSQAESMEPPRAQKCPRMSNRSQSPSPHSCSFSLSSALRDSSFSSWRPEKPTVSEEQRSRSLAVSLRNWCELNRPLRNPTTGFLRQHFSPLLRSTSKGLSSCLS